MKNKGQTLIELLITIGLSAILIPALLVGFSVARSGRAQQEQRLQATGYLKEAQEAVRIIDLNNWDNLVNGTYHPIVSGSTWALASGSQTISGFGFTRQIVISDVFRDSNGNIVTSGGILDPSAKHITISVSWTNPIASSVSADSYLTRHKNLSHLETTVADFNAGTLTNTAVIATLGTGIPNNGQVELGTGGGNGHGGDWCAPNLNLTSISLPQASSTNAIYAVPGKAFVGIGDISSQGQGENFVAINITQTYPPTASIQGGPPLNIDNTYGDFGDLQYAYLALDRTTKQLQVVDTVTGNQLTQKGYFTAPVSSRGTSIYVVGTVGYLTVSNKLYAVNLDTSSCHLNSTCAHSQLAGSSPVTLAGTGVKVVVVGSYAYVINSATSNQFQIINLSNYTVSGSLTLNNQPARDLVVNQAGDRAYVITKLANGQNTFYIINTDSAHKTSPSVMTSVGTNGMDPKGLNIVTGNKAIVVGLGGTKQYQVFNIAGDVITTCGNGLSVPSGIYGVASVNQDSSGDAYSYITTGDSHFRVILGGNGSNFSSSGTFESGTFSTTNSAAFNFFSATIATPSQTSMQFQFAAAPLVNNSCTNSTFSYVGPLGSQSAYFIPTASASAQFSIPYGNYGTSYQNPARCFRYKAFFNTSDVTQSPILYDAALSYSP